MHAMASLGVPGAGRHPGTSGAGPGAPAGLPGSACPSDTSQGSVSAQLSPAGAPSQEIRALPTGRPPRVLGPPASSEDAPGGHPAPPRCCISHAAGMRTPGQKPPGGRGGAVERREPAVQGPAVPGKKLAPGRPPEHGAREGERGREPSRSLLSLPCSAGRVPSGRGPGAQDSRREAHCRAVRVTQRLRGRGARHSHGGGCPPTPPPPPTAPPRTDAADGPP